MSDITKKYDDGVLKPEWIDGRKVDRKTYARQIEEAQIINKLFEKTPVQIIADDVGTGKTWVAMATLFARLAIHSDSIGTKKRRQHAIVIAPTRVVANKWVRELRQFNRNFVEEPQKTSIDQLFSTTSLLNAIDFQGRSFVPEAKTDFFNLPLPGLFKSTSKRDQTPQVFLLHLLETYADLHKDTFQAFRPKALAVYESFRTAYHKSSHGSKRRLLKSVLPQQRTANVIQNLRCYAWACKSCRWYEHDYDPTVWTANIDQNKNWLSTWFQDLGTHVLKPRHKLSINRIIQIVSVLWSTDLRSPIAPSGAVLSLETAAKLNETFIKDSFQTLIALLLHGIPEEAQHLLYSRLPHLAAQRDVVTQPLDCNQCQRILNMLAAYAARVEYLSDFAITIDHPFMDRFAAAGVFKDSADLQQEINKDVSENRWSRLIDFILPAFKANSCSQATPSLQAQYRLINESKDGVTHETYKLSKDFNPKCFDSLVQRLSRAILQLVDYDVHPDRVGSTFWFELPKERAIHVLYMNDLNIKTSKNKKGITTQSNLAQEINPESPLEIAKKLSIKLPKRRDVTLSIVDEAHNWRNRAYGAESYNEFIRSLPQRSLLITATPLHMSANDLKTIIDLVLPNRWEKQQQFNSFKTSYDALFSEENKADNLLKEAADKQRKVTKAWQALCDDKDAYSIIDARKKSIDQLPQPYDMKSAQREAWKNLLKSPNKAVASLAEHVLALEKFQTTQFLRHLTLIIVKTRSQKNFQEMPCPNATRRYICGREASILASRNMYSPAADDKHALLHPCQGLDNGNASWVDLIGMRLSEMPIDKSSIKSAKLLVGLPSSYEALWEGATFKLHKNSADKTIEDTRPEFTRYYSDLFEKCRTNVASEHAKVTKTVDIAFQNLLRGEKTLIFCQRIPTVNAIQSRLKKRLDAFLEPLLKDIFIRKNPTADAIRALKDIMSHAKTIAKKINESNNITDIHDSSFDFLYDFLTNNSKDKKFSAAEYDARVVWLLNAVFNQTDRVYNQQTRNKLLKYLRAIDVTEEQADIVQRSEFSAQTSQKLSALRTVTGDTNYKGEILANFSSPLCPLILVCSQVSQEGVDMHKFCRTIVLHDLNWNPAILEQRIGRLDRIGSYAAELKLPVDIYVPFLADSYDEYQYDRVLQRADMQELVFGRNDKVISDKEFDESINTVDVESSEKKIPLLGSLIHGFFDMNLSTNARQNAWIQKEESKLQE